VKSMVSRRQIPKNDLFGVRIAKVGLTHTNQQIETNLVLDLSVLLMSRNCTNVPLKWERNETIHHNKEE
ncbi:MAG: hypothetical protein L6Q53_13585, partial [Candidatus Brocadia sinica]|nr:hypothetical protein [Candidatus Brocadia sinica]